MHHKTRELLKRTFLELLQGCAEGRSGNIALRQMMESHLEREIDKTDYDEIKQQLIDEGIIGKAQGKGGAVYLLTPDSEPRDSDTTMEAPDDTGFSLEAQVQPTDLLTPRKTSTPASPRANPNDTTQVLAYRHDEKRKNNPHVGMVDVSSDDDESKKTWAYDPHLAPELQFDGQRSQIEALIDDALASQDPAQMQAALEQLKTMQSPFLNWAGKAERTSFEVDTVSLHVHERIDPATILAEVQKRIKDSKGNLSPTLQPDLFHAPFENLPLREAVDFYRHERDWANRLVAGDSLLVMNSLIQKESMAGRVQMIYFDPPYGIKYGSNFQPFVNKRDVKDRKDEDLTQEPEMIKAFRDTWELGIHSYLTYLRDRLLLARELLSDSGSIFVQISDENVHHVREICDEVFGAENFVSDIQFVKTSSATSDLLANVNDTIIWYSKKKAVLKYNQIYQEKNIGQQGATGYTNLLEMSGKSRKLSKEEKNNPETISGGTVFAIDNITSSRPAGDGDLTVFYVDGRKFTPNKGTFKTDFKGLTTLKKTGRLSYADNGTNLAYIRHLNDFPAFPINNIWQDTLGQNQFGGEKMYVVQTALTVVQRCMLMTTDPADLVLDITCGSGTTAVVAEKWGRRWITCDTSRVAITLAKQRLMTASYDYFELKYPNEGLKGGFIYKTVPHVTLKSIANNPEIDSIYERMHPAIEEALSQLNQTLRGHNKPFSVTEGARKGQTLDFTAKNSDSQTLPSGETAYKNALLEWEVPFDYPTDPEQPPKNYTSQSWPTGDKHPVRLAFDAFHRARQAMQKQMDASIAANAGQETLYDQPEINKKKLRITGPFTVEAVPFATVLGMHDAEQTDNTDVAIARSGETSRQSQWRDELLKTGIRGKGGQMLKLTGLEPIPSAHYIHAVGTVADTGERVAVSFGPDYAALEQRQVEIAKSEAGDLFPTPKLLVFCAFSFDPEAAKDIDSIKGITALKVQMNTDLLTEDLKTKRASNQSFWLMGQPDVALKKLKDGQYQVEVNGFDYFNTKTGELDSGGKKNIAMWSLDTDYDNRSLYPRQVFFPMAGNKDGWYRLKKDIRAELDESKLDQFHGTRSLPFAAGANRCIAVKIVDDRGIESLKVMRLED